MAQTTVKTILRGMKEVLLTPAAIDIVQTSADDEIDAGVADAPTVQIYQREGDNLRLTFQAVGQRHDMTVFIDVIVTERSNIGEDLEAVTGIQDQLIELLQNEQGKGEDADPMFGVTDINGVAVIKDFGWRWELISFEYARVKFVGIRFTVELMIY